MQDIDPFTPVAGATVQVLDAVRTALAADGYAVHVLRAADDGDFAELHVSRDGETTQLDLGRDRRAHDSVRLDVGPVLHLDDAVGSKTTALLGRALPRDFIDVAAALDRYSRPELLELAFTRDPGLRAADAALAAQQLDRLQDDQFMPYQVTGDDIAALRQVFASWPRDAASDLEAHAAHKAGHPPPPTAAERAAAASPRPSQTRCSSPRSPTPRHPRGQANSHPPSDRDAERDRRRRADRVHRLCRPASTRLRRARARASTAFATRWSPVVRGPGRLPNGISCSTIAQPRGQGSLPRATKPSAAADCPGPRGLVPGTYRVPRLVTGRVHRGRPVAIAVARRRFDTLLPVPLGMSPPGRCSSRSRFCSPQ